MHVMSCTCAHLGLVNALDVGKARGGVELRLEVGVVEEGLGEALVVKQRPQARDQDEGATQGPHRAPYLAAEAGLGLLGCV